MGALAVGKPWPRCLWWWASLGLGAFGGGGQALASVPLVVVAVRCHGGGGQALASVPWVTVGCVGGGQALWLRCPWWWPSLGLGAFGGGGPALASVPWVTVGCVGGGQGLGLGALGGGRSVPWWWARPGLGALGDGWVRWWWVVGKPWPRCLWWWRFRALVMPWVVGGTPGHLARTPSANPAHVRALGSHAIGKSRTCPHFRQANVCWCYSYKIC